MKRPRLFLCSFLALFCLHEIAYHPTSADIINEWNDQKNEDSQKQQLINQAGRESTGYWNDGGPTIPMKIVGDEIYLFEWIDVPRRKVIWAKVGMVGEVFQFKEKNGRSNVYYQLTRDHGPSQNCPYTVYIKVENSDYKTFDKSEACVGRFDYTVYTQPQYFK